MNEEKAIEDIFTTYVETWRKNDMDAWGALFTDDADVATQAGVWWKSNRENVEGHKAIPETVAGQMADYGLRSAGTGFLKPDVALVHAVWEWPGFIQSPDEEPADREGIITMGVTEREGKWLIRAPQNMRIQ